MKKALSELLLLALISVSIPGCGRNEVFGKDLVLAKDDPSHVYLFRRSGSGGQVVVDQQIVDMIQQGGLLLILRKVAESFECDADGSKSIITNYSSKSEYWIVEIHGAQAYGPMNKEEFDAAMTNRSIRMERPLRDGGYHPNSSEFEKVRATCKKLKPI